MTERVKPKSPRRYDSSRRQQLAKENRRVMLDAARARFLRDGYARTTVNDIAADAGVSVQTVYKAFANKAGVLAVGLFVIVLLLTVVQLRLERRVNYGR